MDTYDFLTDPRALPLDERQAARQRCDPDQRRWLEHLRRLAEPPLPADDFPAYLLATPAFADLAHRIEQAAHRSELSTATADELDWFVSSFADYLRTCEGEDAFTGTPAQRAG